MRHRSISLAVLALALSCMVGCGTHPTQPDVTPAPSGVSAARTAESAGLLTDITKTLVGLVVRTLDVVGSLGGSLSNGRWRVDIPAGAISGTATVAVGVPSLTSSNVQLEILPLTKNSFAKPVMLTVDCRSASSTDLQTYVICWYNPDTRVWVPVQGSKVDLTRKTVTAPLQHFSKYAVIPLGGKSGW